MNHKLLTSMSLPVIAVMTVAAISRAASPSGPEATVVDQGAAEPLARAYGIATGRTVNSIDSPYCDLMVQVQNYIYNDQGTALTLWTGGRPVRVYDYQWWPAFGLMDDTNLGHLLGTYMRHDIKTRITGYLEIPAADGSVPRVVLLTTDWATYEALPLSPAPTPTYHGLNPVQVNYNNPSGPTGLQFVREANGDWSWVALHFDSSPHVEKLDPPRLEERILNYHDWLPAVAPTGGEWSGYLVNYVRFSTWQMGTDGAAIRPKACPRGGSVPNWFSVPSTSPWE